MQRKAAVLVFLRRSFFRVLKALLTSYIKFPVQIVLGVILGKPAELSITRKKEKLRPKVLELLITPGPTTTPLISTTLQLLTKALLEREKH